VHTGTYKYFQIFFAEKKEVNHTWFRGQTSVVRVNGLGFALSVSVNVEYKTCKCKTV
jgi:hypothetical protein